MDPASLLKEANPVLGEWRRSERAFYFLLIPIVLLTVFFLPLSIKQYLVLQPGSPTPLSVFANHYTHTDTMHLVNNLAVYLLTVFVIFNLEPNRKRFHAFSTVFFLLTPVVVSLLVVRILPTFPPMQGFSAIVTSFNGYIIYSAYAYLKSRFDFIGLNFIAIPLFANIGMLCMFNNYGISLIVICLIALAAVIAIEFRHIRMLVKDLFGKLKSMKPSGFRYLYSVMVASSSITLLFSLPFLVPLNFIEGAAIINTVGHYAGWVIGLFVPVCLEYIGIVKKIPP